MAKFPYSSINKGKIKKHTNQIRVLTFISKVMVVKKNLKRQFLSQTFLDKDQVYFATTYSKEYGKKVSKFQRITVGKFQGKVTSWVYQFSKSPSDATSMPTDILKGMHFLH